MSHPNTNKKPLLLHLVPTAKMLLAFFAGQIEYMKKNGMLPDRQKILGRLNSMSLVLTENIGLKFAFE